MSSRPTNKMSSAKANRSRGRRFRGKGRRGNNAQNALMTLANLSSVPRETNFRNPFPMFEMVPCRFFDRLVVQGAVSFIVLDFRINSVWQPVLGGATGVVSGYAGAAARYESYRVERYKFSIRVNANENFACSFAVIFSDRQQSTVISTYQQALTAVTSGGHTLSDMVGTTAGSSKYDSRVFTVYPGHVVGNPLMYVADRDFSSSTGANPSQSVWGAFILVSDTSAQNLTNGVFLDWNAEIYTRFFSVLSLA